MFYAVKCLIVVGTIIAVCVQSASTNTRCTHTDGKDCKNLLYGAPEKTKQQFFSKRRQGGPADTLIPGTEFHQSRPQTATVGVATGTRSKSQSFTSPGVSHAMKIHSIKTEPVEPKTRIGQKFSGKPLNNLYEGEPQKPECDKTPRGIKCFPPMSENDVMKKAYTKRTRITEGLKIKLESATDARQARVFQNELSRNLKQPDNKQLKHLYTRTSSKAEIE